MDIEKYLKKEKLEKSVSNLKANDWVKQKILDESKDTDYEKWLFSLERKSLVKKNMFSYLDYKIYIYCGGTFGGNIYNIQVFKKNFKYKEDILYAIWRL